MAASPQTAQGARQASVRAVTGTAGTYEGDWHALFTLAGIPAGTTDTRGVYTPAAFNGRLLAWINLKLTKAYTNLPEAMQALAVANGAFNFSSMGAFDASTNTSPALLLETGSYLLLEDGFRILLEA